MITIEELKKIGAYEEVIDYLESKGVTVITYEWMCEHREEVNSLWFVWVAKQISVDALPQMMKDEDFSVRIKVAERIDIEYLPQMMKDENYKVRITVVQRIGAEHLSRMLRDKHSVVRWFAAERTRKECLPQSGLDQSCCSGRVRTMG